jgi:hypothetical protein
MFSPAEGEEHSIELLEIFSQEVEQEITATLEFAAEEEADNMDFVDLYEELEALERRVIVKSHHIQQVKLETDGGADQPMEQLEEVGIEPTQEELTEDNLSGEEVENSSMMRLQDWSLQQGGKLRPQEMKKQHGGSG